MRFRDDILQGLRLGVILLAAVLTGLISYRYLRDRPAEISQPKKAEPALANAPPFVVPAPPPPTGHPPVRRRASARGPAQNTTPTEDQTQVEENYGEADATGTDQEKEGPDATAEKGDAAASGPVVGGEDKQNHGNRGKRWLKAVGHFFHIGSKKDLPPQAVRQP